MRFKAIPSLGQDAKTQVSWRLAAMMSAFLCGPLWGQDCYYEVTVLDLIPDCGFGQPGSTTPRAIADNGWMTGKHPQCNGTGFSWAMLNTGGTAVEELIPPFAGVWNAEGRGISSTGVIVGSMDMDGVGQRGFIYDGTEWTKLDPFPGGVSSVLNDVSDNGQFIVGYRQNSTGEVAYLNDGSSSIDIPPTFGDESIANAVNNQGDVVGWMGTSLFNQVAFLYGNGQSTELGFPPNATTSDGKAVNNLNQVAVTCLMSAGDPLNRLSAVFLYDNGNWTDIGILPGYDSMTATGITDDGAILGWCRTINTSPQSDKAYLWNNGVMTALEDLIDPTTDMEFLRTGDINNHGVIACIAVGSELEATSAVALRSPYPADIDQDCVVTVNDLLILLGEWGFAPESSADLNNDKHVNVVDLLFLLSHWG